MFIQSIPSGPFRTNAYVLGCPETKQALIIDPSPGSAQQIIDCLSQNHLVPVGIVLTHSHWDHIADVARLKETYYPIPISIHALDAPNLERPGADGLPFWISIESVTPDHFLDDEATVTFGKQKLHVIHTPGHSPGSICLYNKEEGILLSGDTLFKGSIGNLSFPTSQPELMWPSLDKLAKIPPQTRVYPGHGPSTTIGAEHWLPEAKKHFGEEDI